jgi:hypothetical protein
MAGQQHAAPFDRAHRVRSRPPNRRQLRYIRVPDRPIDGSFAISASPIANSIAHRLTSSSPR